MPSRNVLIGAYIGFVVVALVVLLYVMSPGTTTTPPPTTTPTQPTTTPTDSKVVVMNNGSVSGQTYCAGKAGASWNNELPASWNGAKCISAGFNADGTPTGVDCGTIPGVKPGFRVLCQANNVGWYGAPIVVKRNDGTVSGQRYCAGTGGAPWWNELPLSWNGAKCISAGFNATGTPTGVDCATIPGQKPGFRILCGPSGTGWAQ